MLMCFLLMKSIWKENIKIKTYIWIKYKIILKNKAYYFDEKTINILVLKIFFIIKLLFILSWQIEKYDFIEILYFILFITLLFIM